MVSSASDFCKKRVLTIEQNVFIRKIFVVLVGYIGITFWLNAIRASASLWFVWVLIIIQFLLYFSIFSVSYYRSKECGLKSLGIPIFVTLAVLGRIENWELFIIPLVVIVMLIISWKKSKSKFSNEDVNYETYEYLKQIVIKNDDDRVAILMRLMRESKLSFSSSRRILERMIDEGIIEEKFRPKQ